MSIAGLDSRRTLALIEEMGSARNLLAYGLRALRMAAFIDTTRDPILTMLSIGLEKLYKLTLGFVSLDQHQVWPSKAQMKDWGHRLVDMHGEVMAHLRAQALDRSQYVQDLISRADADPVLPPLIGALDMYGRMGRFYYLDLLGDEPQAWAGPSAAWSSVEQAVLNDPEVAALYAKATSDIGENHSWNSFIGGLNDRVATALEHLWITVAVCGQNRAYGEVGRTLGFEVHPNAVGRQLMDSSPAVALSRLPRSR